MSPFFTAGEFTMGSNDGYDNEKPAHKVYLDAYWMGKYEVIFDQFDKYCTETNKNKPPDDFGYGRGKRPIINVSWDDANAYCDWLSKETGLKYKLPTEAQWEKAAVGVTTPGTFVAPFAALAGPPIPSTSLASACARIIIKYTRHSTGPRKSRIPIQPFFLFQPGVMEWWNNGKELLKQRMVFLSAL